MLEDSHIHMWAPLSHWPLLFWDTLLHLLISLSEKQPLIPTPIISSLMTLTPSWSHQPPLAYFITRDQLNFITYPFSPASWSRVRHSPANQAYRNLSAIEAPSIPNPHWLNHANCISNWVCEEENTWRRLYDTTTHSVLHWHMRLLIMVCLKIVFLCWFCMGSDHQGWAPHRSWGQPGK